MMNGSGQPPTYDGNLPVIIKLPLVQWQQIMQVLVDTPVPWKTINPLVIALDREIQTALQSLPTVGEGPRPQA